MKFALWWHLANFRAAASTLAFQEIPPKKKIFITNKIMLAIRLSISRIFRNLVHEVFRFSLQCELHSTLPSAHRRKLGAIPPSGWKVMVPSLLASSVLENDRFFTVKIAPVGVSSHLLLASIGLGGSQKTNRFATKNRPKLTTQKEARRRHLPSLPFFRRLEPTQKGGF